MHPAIEAALELQEFLELHGQRFCIIGGLAVQRWGEVRLTVASSQERGTRFLPGQKKLWIGEIDTCGRSIGD